MARTRYQRGDQADSDCTPATDENKPLLSSETGGNETLSVSVAQGTMDGTVFAFITAAGDPGGLEDLDSGLFRCQLDVTVAGSNLTYFVRFRSRDDACAGVQSSDMGEADFSGTGLKLATKTFDPLACDRWSMEVLVTHSGAHSDPAETITLRTNNSDAFFEFPDAPSSAPLPGLAMAPYTPA